MNMAPLHFILAAFFVLAGCKRSASNGGASGDAVFPKRVGAAGDATALEKIGVFGKGGGTSLSIDLERMPNPANANLWNCWQLPEADMALGHAVCTGHPDKTAEITAASVDFTCGSNPDFGTVKAKTPLSLDYCESYDIFAYQFEPQLALKVNN